MSMHGVRSHLCRPRKEEIEKTASVVSIIILIAHAPRHCHAREDAIHNVQ